MGQVCPWYGEKRRHLGQNELLSVESVAAVLAVVPGAADVAVVIPRLLHQELSTGRQEEHGDPRNFQTGQWHSPPPYVGICTCYKLFRLK